MGSLTARYRSRWSNSEKLIVVVIVQESALASSLQRTLAVLVLRFHLKFAGFRPPSTSISPRSINLDAPEIDSPPPLNRTLRS
jgi:hypothetical protein